MARVTVAQCNACGGDLKVKEQAVLKRMNLTCRCGEHQTVETGINRTAQKSVRHLKDKNIKETQAADDDFNVGDISIIAGIIAYIVLFPIYGLCWFFGDDSIQSFFQVMDWVICGGIIILVLMFAFGLDWSDRQDGNTILMGSGVVLSISAIGICFYPVAKLFQYAPTPWADELVKTSTLYILTGSILVAGFVSFVKSKGNMAKEIFKSIFKAIIFSPPIVLGPAYLLAIVGCFSWYYHINTKDPKLIYSLFITFDAILVLLCTALVIFIAAILGAVTVDEDEKPKGKLV